MKARGVDTVQSPSNRSRFTGSLEELSAVASAICGVFKLDDLLGLALDKSLDLSRAGKGVIHLLRETDRTLELLAHRGLSPQYVKASPVLALGEQLPGRVAQTGQAVLTNQSSTDVSAGADMMGVEGFGSLVCLPLISNGQVLGSITLLSDNHNHFASDDLPFLEFVARQIAAGIQSARLFEEKEDRVNELAALNEIGQAIGSTLDLVPVLKLVAQKTAHICNVERCSILLLDQQKKKLVPMMSQLASGAEDTELWRVFREETLSDDVDSVPDVAKVVRGGKTVVLDEQSVSRLPRQWTEPFGITCLLLVPLVTREEIIGLMGLDYTTPGRRFSTQQVDLATTIGRQVAMAIENARLYSRQRRRALQLTVINEVGRRATSSLDLETLLRETASAIREGFNYDFVSILLSDETAGEVVQRAESGRAEHMHVPEYSQVVEEGLIGWAVRHRRAIVVNDVSGDSRYLEGFPDRPFTRSEMVVPIIVGDKVIAALDVQSAELNAFDLTDLMSMQAIVDQLTVAMRNAQLYEEITRHSIDLEAANRRLLALQEVGASLARTWNLQDVLQSTVDSVVKGLGYSVAGIGVLNTEQMAVENVVLGATSTTLLQQIERLAGEELRSIRLPLDPESGVVARALSKERLQITDDLRDLFGDVLDPNACIEVQALGGFKTLVTVPLILEDRPLGALCAATEQTDVSHEELASLRVFANQAALAIENVKLYQRTKARLDQLSTLHEVSVAATSTLELTEILDRIVGALQETQGFPNLVLMLLDEEDETGRLKVAAGRGYSPAVAERIDSRVGEGITGWVALTGEPLNVPDVTLDTRYVMADENVRSEVCVPLAVGDKVIGVLNAESSELAAFSDDTVRFLSTLAGQLAVIIENARLFQRVAHSERDWEDTFKAITDGIAICDADLNVLRVNPALASIMETPPEALVGRRCFEIFSYCTGPTNASCPHRRAMQTGEPTSIEVDEPHLRKTLHIFSFPIFDEAGEAKGTVHTVRDTTDDKALRLQLLQTEKLAAIGELVSGVAHELNNPLTSVLGYAQLLQAADVTPEMRDDLRTIYQEAQRSAKIIENLLTFARKETAEKQYTDINQVLRDTLKLRAYQLKVDDVELTRELDENLPWTMAAPHQLQQVFLNLINNAHQAVMGSTGDRCLTLRTETDSRVIRVLIVDNGPGIPEEHIGKIFDPFFTTKDVGQGTGLGLSIAFGIVQEHNGRIWAESEPDEGTTFIVELPIVERPGGDVPRLNDTDTLEGQSSKRMMVIDDEEEILEVVGRILERLGHRVVTVDSAETALDKIASQHYDLVICDVRMPGIGGQGLYQSLRANHPDLAKRVIFTTGDTVSRTTRAFLENVGTPYLSKPFMIEDLQRAIEEVMGNEQTHD
jgi:two-component system NtrC family sensor kinase